MLSVASPEYIHQQEPQLSHSYPHRQHHHLQQYHHQAQSDAGPSPPIGLAYSRPSPHSRQASYQGTPATAMTTATATHPPHHPHNPHPHQVQHSLAPSADVAQALEIARESPDGASDPTVSKILERALSDVWRKVQAQPDSYVMTRDEFAVFNFFQCRFKDDENATAARKRFWDNFRA